ncbi:hypothetical protein IVB48_21255 [Bradyrhizobium sp. 76]|nr:hypothetical protein [Bradyrhizobium sp. 76]
MMPRTSDAERAFDVLRHHDNRVRVLAIRYLLIAQHQKKQRASRNHATLEHNGLSYEETANRAGLDNSYETGVAAATICNGLNVGNNPLKFRKAELEEQPPLIFGSINNRE